MKRSRVVRISVIIGLCVIVALAVGTVWIGQVAEVQVSDETLAVRTVTYYRVPIPLVPLRVTPRKITVHPTKVSLYLKEAGLLTPRPEGSERWLFMTGRIAGVRGWRGEANKMHHLFLGDAVGQEWVEWSKANPGSARVFWTRMIDHVRRRNWVAISRYPSWYPENINWTDQSGTGEEFEAYLDALERGEPIPASLRDQAWFDAMAPDDLSRTMHANAYIYYCLVDARHCAVAYLRQIADEFDDDTARHLLAAADVYDKQTELLSDPCPTEIAPMQWKLKEGESWTQDMRNHQADILDQARDLERQALDQIREALAHIDPVSAATPRS